MHALQHASCDTTRSTKFVNVPVIASGGFGEISHIEEVVTAGADAVAFADTLHYQRTDLAKLRRASGHSVSVLGKFDQGSTSWSYAALFA